MLKNIHQNLFSNQYELIQIFNNRHFKMKYLILSIVDTISDERLINKAIFMNTE